MKKGKLNLLILLILIGLGVSLHLTIMHFQVLTHAGLDKPSFCSFSDKFDCDSVVLSDYAKLGPFSLGGLGTVYFLYLLFPAIYARMASDAVKSTLALPFLSILPGLAYCLYLAYVSSFILKTYCIFCVGTYVITFFVFLLLRSILEIPFSQIGIFLVNYFKAITGKISNLNFKPSFFGNFLYAVLILSVSLFILYGNEKKYAAELEDFDHKAYLDFFYLQKPASIDPKGRPMWGKEGAPVTIVEFSDFECPFCKKAAFTLKARLKEHQKDIAFYYFSYPLDKNCNPYMQRDLHEHACDAAKAALCAENQGKFWPMHDELFENQPQFSKEQILGYAKKLRLDEKALETCMNSEEIKKRVLSDIEAGKAVNLQGTPMVLINGRPMKEWLNPVMLNLVVKEEIKRSKMK